MFFSLDLLEMLQQSNYFFRTRAMNKNFGFPTGASERSSLRVLRIGSCVSELSSNAFFNHFSGLHRSSKLCVPSDGDSGESRVEVSHLSLAKLGVRQIRRFTQQPRRAGLPSGISFDCLRAVDFRPYLQAVARHRLSMADLNQDEGITTKAGRAVDRSLPARSKVNNESFSRTT